MRVLLWHGWVLEGSGSNVSTAKVAETLRRAGHDVVLVCQEPRPERFGWIDEHGTVGAEGLVPLTPTGAEPAAGRCVLLRPEIGSLLPVFVVDDYEGFEVRPFPDLTDAELDAYLARNVAAVRAAATWRPPDAAIFGHAFPGAVVARRALGPVGYVVKVHGSDLEYAARLQRRLAELTREGLEGATAVAGPTRDVLRRALEFAPTAADRTVVIPPGVDVERFRPRPRTEALEEAARLLALDSDTTRGRTDDLGWVIERAVLEDPDLFDRVAGSYDQSVPDRSSARRLRGLAAKRGPIVGYFGKLIEQKGVHLLLQALAILPGRVRGLVVGFGQYRERLWGLVVALDRGDPEWVRRWEQGSRIETELTDEDIVSARGLAGRLTFTGRLDHRYAPYAVAAMDVLVVPSILDEAFGMVAAEGAACGALPLVARHSGLAEVADALESDVGRAGLFSYEPGPGAVRRIAGGLDILLGLAPAERAELRQAVSSFVARAWSWERTAARLLEAGAGHPAAARRTSTSRPT